MKDRKTILVVDDTPENIAVLTGFLGELYRVKAATSAEKALALCSGDARPDLVLTDLQMPGMDGYEFCRRLKADASTAGIPVIFVSALSEEADEAEGFAVGAVDYISKPIKPAVVLHRVRLHLELVEARGRLESLGRQYSSYLAPELARSIEAGALGTGVSNRRKKLTIFFSDIQGFTNQTEKLEPEDMTSLLNSYFEAMNEVIARHGGTLDKYIGDAIMVFFGDPDTQGLAKDATACVAMALEMQERILDLQAGWKAQGIADPLRVRMGITTGFCTVGNFGSSHKIDYTALGSPVNLASRLQSHARPGTALVSEDTWLLVGDHFKGVLQPSLRVKGFNDPVRAWEVRPSTSQTTDPWDVLATLPPPSTPGDKERVRGILAGLLDRFGGQS